MPFRLIRKPETGHVCAGTTHTETGHVCAGTARYDSRQPRLHRDGERAMKLVSSVPLLAVPRKRRAYTCQRSNSERHRAFHHGPAAALQQDLRTRRLCLRCARAVACRHGRPERCGLASARWQWKGAIGSASDKEATSPCCTDGHARRRVACCSPSRCGARAAGGASSTCF